MANFGGRIMSGFKVVVLGLRIHPPVIGSQKKKPVRSEKGSRGSLKISVGFQTMKKCKRSSYKTH